MRLNWTQSLLQSEFFQTYNNNNVVIIIITLIFSNLLVANQPIYGTLPAQGEHEVIHCLLAKRLQAVLAGWEVVHSSRVFEKT